MDRPLLLDLFCGAGGAGEGYRRAGFEVVGIDIEPRPRYPFEFIQADATTFPLDGFAAIHASPPCQDYSLGAHISRARKVHPDYPRLLAPMRERLRAAGVPWIMENVAGAVPDMENPIWLCGTTFGLRVWRHRWFESNCMLFAAGPCNHQAGDVSVRRKRSEYIGIRSGATYQDGKGRTRYRPKSCRFADAAAAMGVDWPMTYDELGEAIPPAYTEWLGRQLMAFVRMEVAA